MAKKIQQMHARCRVNAWPAMLQALGRQIGVSADSLARLGVGWAPVVQFRARVSYTGWWTIPERDADGGVVGIGLRGWPDGSQKLKVPGSNSGLVYELNPDHEQGRQEYHHGAHNWARLYDAGVGCPVCHHEPVADAGCMVSSEDPEDPKAATCIRVEEGAIAETRLGYVHALKDEGRLQGTAPLPPSRDSPVVVVEGMTDTAAAMDLGFTAIGRPGHLTCIEALGELVRGRDVVVVGENDDVNPQTNRRPGHEGMVAAYQTLRRKAKNVRQVLPPEHLKDLRQWAGTGLTAADFLEYVNNHAHEEDEEKVLPDSKPSTLAQSYLNRYHRMAGRYILRYYRGQWFRYNGTRYEEVEEESEIRGPMYRWADDKKIIHRNTNGEETIKPLECHRNTVNDIRDAMYDPCSIGAKSSVPCWINEADGPNPEDLIVFTNGILWLSKYLEGAPESEYMLDATPDFFTMFALPFAFDPTAQCPTFRRWLRMTLADDPDKPRLLREWAGYCLTPDTSMHKMMLFRGPPRSGKSTALDVLQAIVGYDQCVSTSFGALTSNFGLQPLVGTQLAVMGDARLPAKADNMRALEVLLNIVGGDVQQIDRKFLPPLKHHKLKTKFTISTNSLPELPDHSGALESRLNILDFNKSFIGKEDWRMREKLVAEAPGIVVWALEGLRRLRNQDRFTLPESSKESLREFRATTSPTAAFVEECCEEDPQHETPKRELFDAWLAWSGERGIRPVGLSRFLERLKANSSYARSHTYMQNGNKHNVFQGIKLQPWAERNLLGKPQ
jgi:putative DNA primase/helicase